MREIVAVTGNVMLIRDGDNNWCPNAELIIITSEVQYRLDEDLELKSRRRACETIHILVNEKVINEVIYGLEKIRFAMQVQSTAANNANLERKSA